MIKIIQKAMLSLLFIAQSFNSLATNNQISENSLRCAISDQNINLVKELISNGANVNYQPIEEAFRDYFEEETALMIAVKHKNIELIKLLIESGADVNAIAYRSQPHMGSTVLRYAIDSGSLEAVELLLNAGANPNELVDGGLFDIANADSKIESCQFYLQKNNVRNNPLLSYAVSRNSSKDIAEALIKAGADVNGTSPLWGYDWTALMVAIVYGNTELTSILLKHNANKNLKNKAGHTALDLAKQFEYSNIVKILEK